MDGCESVIQLPDSHLSRLLSTSLSLDSIWQKITEETTKDIVLPPDQVELLLLERNFGAMEDSPHAVTVPSEENRVLFANRPKDQNDENPLPEGKAATLPANVVIQLAAEPSWFDVLEQVRRIQATSLREDVHPSFVIPTLRYRELKRKEERECTLRIYMRS